MIKMICLILGGGAGSRLFPLTEHRSKPAVPIGGKYRLIDIPISNCINSGVKRMYVLTQYNSASLNAHIKNSYNFDIFTKGFVDILAAEQTPGNNMWFQGTADAVRQSRQHYERQDFDYVLLLSGDQLYQMDFEEMVQYHISQKADITIACLPVDDRDAPGFGIMKVDENGNIPRFIEKPHPDELPNWVSEVSPANKKRGRNYMASMGIYIFNRKALNDLFDQYSDATDFGKEIIPQAINEGRTVAAYHYEGYWTDIGTIPSFHQANLDLTVPLPSLNLYNPNYPIYTHARFLPGTKINGCAVTRSVLCEGSIITGAKISDSIVGIRATVQTGTTIDRSIIMGANRFEPLAEAASHAVQTGIGRDCTIRNAIIDFNARIGDGCKLLNEQKIEEAETPNYSIRGGIIVVPKNAELPPGTVI